MGYPAPSGHSKSKKKIFYCSRSTLCMGGGGWNAIRYQILDPLKIQISDPPPKKKSCVHKKSDIWLKKSDIRQKKNYYQISHPLKKIKYQISRTRYPRSNPPPLFVCLNVQIMVFHNLLRPLVCASLW